MPARLPVPLSAVLPGVSVFTFRVTIAVVRMLQRAFKTMDEDGPLAALKILGLDCSHFSVTPEQSAEVVDVVSKVCPYGSHGQTL